LILLNFKRLRVEAHEATKSLSDWTHPYTDSFQVEITQKSIKSLEFSHLSVLASSSNDYMASLMQSRNRRLFTCPCHASRTTCAPKMHYLETLSLIMPYSTLSQIVSEPGIHESNITPLVRTVP
jgi:hypothetical protein